MSSGAQAVLPGGLGRVRQHQQPSLLLPLGTLDPRQEGQATKDETQTSGVN